MTGRAAVEIIFSEKDRFELEARVRCRKIARADAMRAELLAADGLNNCAIADEVGVSRMTVLTWRKRFAARRLQGLDDETRCGASPKIGDEKITEVVTKTLDAMSVDATLHAASPRPGTLPSCHRFEYCVFKRSALRQLSSV
jgi:Homeodomain-like domain